MRLFFHLPCFALCCLLLSCSSARHLGRRMEREVRRSPIFDQAFTGFVLMEPATGRVLSRVNAHKRFTPASNTKIFTLYTALHLLGDSVPAFRYQPVDGGVRVFGLGDPTFLHPQFAYWRRSFDFLKKSPLVYWSIPEGDQPPYGPGWAWDDAQEDYQAEMSAFPVYANLRRVYATSDTALSIGPRHFKGDLLKGPRSMRAGTLRPTARQILYAPASRWPKGFEQWVPIANMRDHLQPLLQDTLQHAVAPWENHPEDLDSPSFKTLYSTPIDTVLRRMMHQSDNFIADQLLLACGAHRLGLARQDSVIAWMLRRPLRDLPQPPRWVDGSGLSRYNLFSPHDVALVLRKLWLEQPQQRLLSPFPAGGVSGTVAD
ncbi:MAG TPA: D-alanyl-D-alanine carboxypeptidase, partial [Saprospiraceae bacterium]|nr:D-alanyl-D-alanine carboxypeptidase [Saprospiraceae bacterium]